MNKHRKIILYFIKIILLTSLLIANSRVSFSRPGNMMRTPDYAFNHKDPYFFSLSLSSEIINLSQDYNSQYARSSNIAAFQMQTNSGYTFGMTAGNIIDPRYMAEIGFHFQRSIFKHGDVSLSAGIQDILYKPEGVDNKIDLDDMSLFAVLTSRKTFDDYRLSINVGAGSGKVKYDPHINSNSSNSGTGLFLGFNLNTPYLSRNGGMELIVEYDGNGINMGTLIPFTNDYSMSLGMTQVNNLGQFGSESRLGNDYQDLQPDAPAITLGITMNIPNAPEPNLNLSDYPNDITDRELELLNQISVLEDSVKLMQNEITLLSDNNLLLKHKVAIFMDSTRVFYLKEQANQSINNRVARYLTRCLRHFYKEEYRDALVEIDKAIDLNPNIALAYARRGSIYYKLGDMQRATMNWNIALKLDPEFEEIQELLLASKEERLQSHSMSK